MTVVGIATFGDADSLGRSTLRRRSTSPTAERLLAGGAGRGLVDPRRTATDRRRRQARAAARIAAGAAAPALEAVTGAELTAEQQHDIDADFLGLFRTFLLASPASPLVVATFSIHNTFSILVAQRTRESALLRAVGASRRQVVVGGRRRGARRRRRRLGDRARRRHRAGRGAAGADGRAPASPCPPAGLVIGHRHAVVAAAGRRGRRRPCSPASAPALRASRVAPLAALRTSAVDAVGAVEAPAVARRRRRSPAASASSRADRRLRDAGARAGPGSARWSRSSARWSSARSSPGPRPPCSARRRAAAARPDRSPRPAQRDAQPPAHRGERVGADGRHRRGRPVHHVRRVGQGVDRRPSPTTTSAATSSCRPTGSVAPSCQPDLAPAIGDVPGVAAAVAVSYAAGSASAARRSTSRRPTSGGWSTRVRRRRRRAARPTGSVAATSPSATSTPATTTWRSARRCRSTLRRRRHRRPARGGDLRPADDVRRRWSSTRPTSPRTPPQPQVDGRARRRRRRRRPRRRAGAIATVTDEFGAPAPLDRGEYEARSASQVDPMLFVVYGLLGVAVLIALLASATRSSCRSTTAPASSDWSGRSDRIAARSAPRCAGSR